MFFFNLSLGEFAALFAAVNGAVLALYLLDRSRRKIKVATMRFWRPSEKPPEAKHRRRIQQPWSMIMQIVGMGLLLAAIAQLRLGSPDTTSRDHVLLLDTSAWTAAKADPQRRLIDEAKVNAIRWLRALPGSDRVMVVRADALPTPATVFETNRGAAEQAIVLSQPSSSALNLQAALDFARRMQRQHGQSAGEIVFAGAGRTNLNDLPDNNSLPQSLRLLPVQVPNRNAGIRRFHLRRAPNDSQLWEIFIAVRNYGRAPETVPLMLTFGNAPIGSSRLTIAPGAEETARYEFRTKAAGWMEARLQLRDGLAEDNVALLEIPEQKQVRVAIFTRQPELLRALMAANPRITAAYAPPEAYKADTDADILVLDRFRPAQAPKRPALWIQPPADGSPLAVSKANTNARITRWRTEHPIAQGLRSLDLKLDGATVFVQSAEAETVAEAEGGSLVAAQPASHSVFLGVHPGIGALRFELAAPLLVANILEWMAPEALRRWELDGESVGTVKVALEANIDPATIQVLTEDQQPLPFSISDNTLQFYSATRGNVRVRAGSRETVYSLSLPDVGDTAWEAPARVRRGLGRIAGASSPVEDLWPWLALLGAAFLVGEWFLFGRLRLPARSGAAPTEIWSRFTAPFRKAS
ncbi:MAG: BatA and WFA domain-containing protein [Bryobacterales bacterium]|nr:BatA and WFA domain-containing protein [Bryobacterales bacterium]